MKNNYTIDNGLIVDTLTSPPTCCGYIFNFNGHGAFAPDGKLIIDDRAPTQAEIDTHNKTLAQGEILGLDQCQIGQWGTFYFSKATTDKPNRITTWTGELVSDDVSVNGKSAIFRRKGKVFRGIIKKDADLFNFKRIT